MPINTNEDVKSISADSIANLDAVEGGPTV